MDTEEDTMRELTDIELNEVAGGHHHHHHRHHMNALGLGFESLLANLALAAVDQGVANISFNIGTLVGASVGLNAGTVVG
jgi:hypothetical protein